MSRSSNKPDLCAGRSAEAASEFKCPGPCQADVPDLCSAITARKRVRFLYNGTFRVVEPHYYGLNAKGEQVLRGYQISSGGLTLDRGWYDFLIDQISGLSETPNEFSRPRTHYDPDGRGLRGHFAKLPND